MTLMQFLIFWSHFTSSHLCQAWQPDAVGLGRHVFYSGNCSDAFALAQTAHGTVTWVGTPPELSQGILSFP